MFEWIGGTPRDWNPGDWNPGDWEPIPDDLLAELPPLPVDGLPDGVDLAYIESCDRIVDYAVAIGPRGPALSLLTSVSPEMLTEAARSIALSQLTEITAHIESARHEMVVAIAGPRPATKSQRRNENFASHEVSVATTSSVYAADSMIALARDLATVLRASRDAMAAGKLSLAQARTLHHATSHLSADVAQLIEARVLRRAHLQSTGNFSRSVTRAAAALDPDWTARAKSARAAAVVSHTAGPDGMGELFIRGPLEMTTAINMALTAFAARTKDTLGGTVDQRKLATLRDWAEAAVAAPDAPTNHGRLPIVNVVCDLATLLGLQQHPAEIPGVGPIPADVARWLLADGAPLRRLVTDPLTGHLLDYGRTTYKVPSDLADYLIARNVTSAGPHSNVPARVSDLDHGEPYDKGGETNPQNVTPFDRRWHLAKTHGDWTYVKGHDGVVIWTSPTGLTCTIEPHDYRLGP
jgi:Domain of unknown function (DUF222)